MTDRERTGDQEPTEAERRRRRAAVFGDVLPETTTDERGDAWSELEAGSDPATDGGTDPATDRATDRATDPAEEWLRRQVPPHHG